MDAPMFRPYVLVSDASNSPVSSPYLSIKTWARNVVSDENDSNNTLVDDDSDDDNEEADDLDSNGFKQIPIVQTKPTVYVSDLVQPLTTFVVSGQIMAMGYINAFFAYVKMLYNTVTDGPGRGRQYVTDGAKQIRDGLVDSLPWLAFYTCIVTAIVIRLFNDAVDLVLSLLMREKYYYRNALLARLPYIYDFTREQGSFRGASNKHLSKIIMLPTNETSPQLSFSFSGCAWLLLYHAGVGQALNERFKPEVFEKIEFQGCSSGSLVAAALTLNTDMQRMIDLMISVASEHAKRFLGPVGIMSQSIEVGMRRELEDDETVSTKLGRRLTVSLTTFPGFENEMKNHFTGRDDLINTIMASSYFPIYWETPIAMTPVTSNNTTASGSKTIYIDGGFTDNLPYMSKTTITVSPHPGEANICPRQPFPFLWILFPPSDEATLRGIVEQGRLDANGWLDKKIEEGILSPLLFNS
ncbi:hypothetical protein SmJEL517_g03884 [Synchytrium microbalum]|uniref:PNPLA domain-containing protein n=1 Tax=Synchytrium microbalum TaxID=1806994 RepID=A0A507BWR1_9FUNG|nr:uncharacterized protein SmJEL517_g03884 [Synchytrium microbalum]TPX33257.1 hypothetical protein SmJEL517_g03884 [Synchytrium microbalum]